MKCVVIWSNQRYSSDRTPFPPVGAVGVVISEIDLDGEMDVIFDGHPCHETMPHDPSWITHWSMIAMIDDQKENVSEVSEIA